MSLTASMWTSVSGLLAHGEKMNVIGNNISNVNTVGFKAQRMDFQDFVYQYIGTAAGMGQVGRGTSIGIVMNDFSQGSFETTTSSTDIAIQGNGFYSVKPLNNNVNYYTRAGNFTFNKDGYLVDPHGYALQGWKIDRTVAAQNAKTARTGTGIVGTGSPVDICLDTFTCPPRHTTQMTLPVNLKFDKVASTEDHSSDPDNPFFSLIQNWDASQDPPLGQNQRAYQTTMEVYDEGGRMHKLTVYFDRVSGSSDSTEDNYIEGYTDSESYWEYIVTMEPGDDVRDFSSTYDPTGMAPTTPNVPDNLKGILAAGTITFSSSGSMKDMSCFVPNSDPGNNSDSWWTGPAGQEVVDLTKFIAAPINSDGYPVIAPNFSGTAGLQTAYGYDAAGLIIDPTKPNPNAEGRLIALDFGMSSKNNKWNFLPDAAGNTPGTGAGGLVTAAGTTRTYAAPETDGAGNNILRAGTSVLTVPAGLTTSNAFSAANPPSNASQWEHTYAPSGDIISIVPNIFTSTTSTGATFTAVPQTPANNATTWNHTFTFAGTPATATFSNNSATTPTLTSTAQTPPHNGTSYDFNSGGNAFVYTSTAPGTNPAATDIAATTWVDPATPVAGGYEIMDAAGNTLFVPDGVAAAAGVTPTAAEVSAYFTANAPSTPTVNNATAYYWDVTDGATNVVVTTNSNAAPAGTYTGSTDNASEYYWNVTGGSTTAVVTTSSATSPASALNLSTPASTTDNATEYYWVDNANVTIRATTITDANPTNAAWVQNNVIVTTGNKYFINGMDGQADVDPTYATTCLGDNFYEHNGAQQDGYTYGDLRYVSVSTDGVLSAAYSNGETLQLYQIVLYDFPSNQNLRREGGNLFTETRESGVPSSGAAGTGTFGTTHGSSLEQSNADLSREFVNMITTQRGFQANSKTITTVDTMLETVIAMKR
ncbi:flagellar hook-basal body complex protein [Desulfovibrio sp. OttesenSCG-928-F20]|nr:flagellar hook-basal body complex protein [Desulfovibrio sp. OttesenSCG-928-M16]MDL2290886.1 flagellar hook-basal body complex protein [Desulfovibrio sp. OttesenSCG-928-F20]